MAAAVGVSDLARSTTAALRDAAERVAQAVSKASGFESKIAAINTQEELEELLQFVMSKLDPQKINATRAKRALRNIFSKL